MARTVKPPQPGSKGSKGFNPSGKHKKNTKVLVKWLESIGYEFVSQNNKVVFKNPDWKRSAIFFGQTPSDTNAVGAMVRTVKKVLRNCEPPFDVDKMPKNISRLRLVGEMDGEEKEETIGDWLDSLVVDYERVSTEMTADGKKDLKLLAEKKGITMGELIEEMIVVYKDSQ